MREPCLDLVRTVQLDSSELATMTVRIHDQYTDAYGATEIDSSVLLLPHYGFESATSPRMA